MKNKNHFGSMASVVLVSPDIPQNTGSIARTCAALDMELHLVKPMGFKIDEKKVRRAGLDYWPHVKLTEHENYDEYKLNVPKTTDYYLSTKGSQSIFDCKFEFPAKFIFGSETKGLPKKIMEEAENLITIPMPSQNIRSLNLSNSVSIVVYEAYRQFCGS